MGDELSDRTVRGSRNEETRQRNLSLLLNAVHASGQLTRSELTHHSGLNCSTVGALVGDLVEAGLVVEAEPQASRQAGRPSPVVRPHADVVDEQTDTVRVAPHLNWVDVPLVSLIEEALALPVHMANDATLGVMAESMFGAGVGSDDVVYLNGSTSGLGGGVVTGGHIVTGVRGFGAELGHILIDPCGTVCGCGRTGCLETEVNIQRVWAAAGQGHVPIDELDHLYADHPSAARGAAELAFGPLLANPVNMPLFEVGSLKSVAN